MFLDLLSYPRSLFNLVFIPLFTMLCSAVAVGVVIPFGSHKAFDVYSRVWARVLCGLAGIRLHVRGEENLKKFPSMILVSNHLALYDIPVLFLAIPISFRMAAKAELFRIPFFGGALRASGMLPIARHNPQESKAALEKAMEKFTRGESFWMAPEGTRFRGEGVGEFKLGAFYLALQANQPVVPICIYGTQHVLPKNSLLVSWGSWRRDVFVHILAPVMPEPKKQAARYEMRDRVRGAIVTAFFQLHSSSGKFHREI